MAQPEASRADGTQVPIIAVASGKGGVGKSTVAVNLACAFAQLGLRVGFLDADIHGPSGPRMFGLTARPELVDGLLEPLKAWGVEVMSIGLLVAEGAPMIWRGPMASSALRQMMKEVRWGGAAAPGGGSPGEVGDRRRTGAPRARADGPRVRAGAFHSTASLRRRLFLNKPRA